MSIRVSSGAVRGSNSSSSSSMYCSSWADDELDKAEEDSSSSSLLELADRDSLLDIVLVGWYYCVLS